MSIQCPKMSRVQHWEYGMCFRNLIGQINEISKLDKVTYFVDELKQATKAEVNYQVPETFENT